jgi:H+-transporting ATPase
MAALYSVKSANETKIGLSDDDVQQRRAKWGMNAVPDTSGNPIKNALGKFWAPVPCMLEAAIILQLALGDYTESAIVAGLLIFNATLGYFQEASAQKTLAALKSHLALNVTVRRNQVWTSIPSTELVPGDLVKLTLGEVVAADVQIVEGNIQVDQSTLTGESNPIDVNVGVQTYAGATVQRGEALAEVITTGVNTKFGRTAELVQSAHVVSSQQKTVMRVVRNLVMFNGCVIILMAIYAYFRHMSNTDIIHLILTAILASIPVALPATFTLAAAIGARALAKLGVLPTRLSAVDEAATMDILCSDKTGTLTCNALTVNAVHPAAGFNETQVLNLARLASSDGGKDPVDVAIRLASDKNKSQENCKVRQFIPFDPATKMAQATIIDSAGKTQQIIKGACAKVFELIRPAIDANEAGTNASDTMAAKQFEEQGYRVLAVAIGQPGAYKLVGLIMLTDPPRDDSAALITELKRLGVRTLMVTGDAFETARIVAQKVGLTGENCTPDKINANVRPETYAIFSGVLPEDKFKLVKIFQNQKHTVGMCGDGVNDAPALRQAQIGIAVSTATDVAKSAAGVVLTKPGLIGIVNAVKEGRIAFQRILTYTLNSMTKKIVQILFLVVGLLMTGHAILTPLLMAVIMITGDFLGMSLTTDNVRGSSQPNSWQIGKLSIAGFVMGIGELIFCTVVLSVGLYHYDLNIGALQTLAFITIIFGNQATTYNNRVRGYLWTTKPSNWVLASSFADICIGSTLALYGIAMTPIPVVLVAGAFVAAIVFAFALDMLKVPLFAKLEIS